MKRYLISGIFFFMFFWASSYQVYANKQPYYSINYPIAKKIIQTISQKIKFSIENLHLKVSAYKSAILKQHLNQYDTLQKQLNTLRDPYYQYQVWRIARQMEGKNIYHNYGYNGRNDDRNTCVNGWCQVMAGTGVGRFQDLAYGRIYLMNKTLEDEKKKKKPNLSQKIPKYINVENLVSKTEELGFIPIDVDWAKRGDMLVQYYWKQRQEYVFAPQHVSILDMIINYNNGIYEIRDWHEGLKNQPFVYRTGHNMESSFNNFLSHKNMYFGFTSQQGKKRALIGKNKNVYQAFGYFGNNKDKARSIVFQLNLARARLAIYRKVFEVLTTI